MLDRTGGGRYYDGETERNPELETMMNERIAIIDAYAEQGIEACAGKGGFWLNGRGFVSLAAARKETGVNMARKREARQEQGAWGEYGWIAAINSLSSTRSSR